MRQRSRPLAVMGAVCAMSVGGLALTACGGSSTPSGTVSSEITVGTGTVGTTPAPASSASTPASSASSAPAGSAAAGGGGDAAAGKIVFTQTAQPSCSTCHALKDAGATGAVGPDLDTGNYDAATIIHQVTNGGAVMPAFKGKLSDQQIKDLAAYITSVAGK